MRQAARIVLSALMAVVVPTVAPADVILTDDEIASALQHGPWPPPQIQDPSNRVSGDARAIALGHSLFSDPVLSVDGQMSCASCHLPESDFTDGLDRAEGRVRLDRNTQSLWNLAAHRWFGWSGDTDNLWAQSLTPILNPDELGHDAQSLQQAVSASPWRPSYEALFGSLEAQTPEETAVNVGKALSAYIETLVSGPTSFDAFRDALADGDMEAARHYPEAAQRGLQIFLGEGRCAFCHSGPAFTNGEFHDAGVPYFLDAGRVDPGRHAGLLALNVSPFTLDGAYSDDPDKTGAWAVRSVRSLHSDFGTFRVPSLRRAAQTAPYMHDGSLPDLPAVLEHYNAIDIERLHSDGEAILRPLELSESELNDLQAFLESLSDDGPIARR